MKTSAAKNHTARESNPPPEASDAAAPADLLYELAPVIDRRRAEQIKGRARIIRLAEGIHAVTIGPVTGGVEPSGRRLSMPSTQVAALPGDQGKPAEIYLTTGIAPGWLGPEGGTVVAKVPAGGAGVVATVFGMPQGLPLPHLQAWRLDGHPQPPRTPRDTADRQPREIPVELNLHIEQQGDCRVPGPGWAGSPGAGLRIEAFGIDPQESVTPNDIEYMAFGPGGRETPWVTGAKLCGTRGQHLPLTGFAVRLALPLRERFEVVYEGSFFSGGVRGPVRNGEVCRSLLSDDPLEAMKLRLIELRSA